MQITLKNWRKSVNAEIANTEVNETTGCFVTVTRRDCKNIPKSLRHPIGMMMYAELTRTSNGKKLGIKSLSDNKVLWAHKEEDMRFEPFSKPVEKTAEWPSPVSLNGLPALNSAKSVNGAIPNTEVSIATRSDATVTRRGRNNASKSAGQVVDLKMYAELRGKRNLKKHGIKSPCDNKQIAA
jgi:hypothetical protein